MYLKNTVESQENNQNKPSHKLATAALIFSLLMTPAIGNSDAIYAQDSAKSKPKLECVEHANKPTDEQLIKKSVKESFAGVKSLKELPRKITYEGIDSKNLPQFIDISPKEITKPISSITITLGTRSFTLTPAIGQITGIELTEKDLILKTTFKNMKYNRHEKLPALFRMLWNTPRGKGEKDGFLLTTVMEV